MVYVHYFPQVRSFPFLLAKCISDGISIIVTINNPYNFFLHSIQIITRTLIIMTNRFISQHLLDNSIFVSTFSPEPILGIIGQSEKSSDLVSDQKRCYIAPVLKRGGWTQAFISLGHRGFIWVSRRMVCFQH